MERKRGKGSGLKLIQNNGDWWLCGDAELKMRYAIDDAAVVLVNETFLVKLQGRLAGLALTDTMTADGSDIKAGRWYSPIDKRSRQRIRESADRGATEVRLKKPSQWVEIRDAELSTHPYTRMSVSPSQLLEMARQAANRLTGRRVSTADGRTVRDYRLQNASLDAGDRNDFRKYADTTSGSANEARIARLRFTREERARRLRE